MGIVRLLWRDADRLPYLYTLRHAAAQYGTDIDLRKAIGREFGELLMDGTVDMLAENYWNQQLSRAKGAPLVSIAAAVHTINEQLVVREGLSTLEDLGGKRIAIRDMRPTNLIDPLWLKWAGLYDDADVIPVPEAESGRWSPWKKVVSGECDAAIVANLFVHNAVAAGLKPMPMGEFGFLGNVVYTTIRDNLDQKRPDMENLVRAAFDTVRAFKNDKARVLDIMTTIPQDLMQPPNITIWTPEERDRVYSCLRDELADPPIPTPEAVLNFYEMARPHYPELEGYNPLTMWDLSIANRVLDERRGA